MSNSVNRKATRPSYPSRRGERRCTCIRSTSSRGSREGTRQGRDGTSPGAAGHQDVTGVFVTPQCTKVAYNARPFVFVGLFMPRDLRNIAIIAHVDHGKTTLVDKLLQQSRTFAAHEH